jgi:hypothetical protein
MNSKPLVLVIDQDPATREEIGRLLGEDFEVVAPQKRDDILATAEMANAVIFGSGKIGKYKTKHIATDFAHRLSVPLIANTGKHNGELMLHGCTQESCMSEVSAVLRQSLGMPLSLSA